MVYAQLPQLEWYARYNSPNNGDDYASDITLDTAGNVYMTGYDGLNNHGFVTIKYSGTGTQQWLSRYYANYNYAMPEPRKVHVDNNGNVFVSGSDQNGLLIKYDENGVQQWVFRLWGIYDYRSGFSDMKIDKNGFIYVTGIDNITTNRGDMVIIKFDQNGDSLWLRHYDYGFGTVGISLCLDDSCNVYATGWCDTVYGGHDHIVTIKYNTDGVQQWVARYSSPWNDMDNPTCMAIDIKSNIYIGGWTDSGEVRNCVTLKYNSDGNLQWSKIYSSGYYPQVTKVNDLTVDNIGNVLITGPTNDSTSNYNRFLTIKYNTRGVQQWIQKGPLDTTNIIGSLPYSICTDLQGSSYVTGDIYTIKYNSMGKILWTMYDTLIHNFTPISGTKILTDKLYSIYLTGNSAIYNSANIDIITCKFSQLMGIKDLASITKKFNLYQNYPNPFNPKTIINYQLPITNYVSLVIYDVLGKEVQKLVNENQSAGKHEIIWDGTNYASGIYFYKLETEIYTETKKMILIR